MGKRWKRGREKEWKEESEKREEEEGDLAFSFRRKKARLRRKEKGLENNTKGQHP